MMQHNTGGPQQGMQQQPQSGSQGGNAAQPHQAGPPGATPVHIPAPAFTPGPGLRFVLLIDGTMAMAGLWPDARAMYLEPLLREMDRGKLGKVEYAVVVFRSKEATYCGALVESSGWMSTVGEVRQVLDGIQLVGGGLCETCLCEALVTLMALLEQPSALDPTVGPPACQAMLLCATDFSRVGIVLSYPPVPYVPGPAGCDSSDVGNSATILFKQLSNGQWRHNHLSLLAALKHGVVPALMATHKQHVARANVPMTRAHTVLIATDFPSAHSILSAERQQRLGRITAAQAGPGQNSGTADARSTGPPPRLTTPGSTGLPSPPMHGGTPPLPLPVGHYTSQQQQQQAHHNQHSTTPMMHGMMPTPPSATNNVHMPIQMPAQGQMQPNRLPQQQQLQQGNSMAAPAWGTKQQAPSPGLNQGTPTNQQTGGYGMMPQQAVQQQQPMDNSMQSAAGMGMMQGMHGYSQGGPGGQQQQAGYGANPYQQMPQQMQQQAVQQANMQQQYMQRVMNQQREAQPLAQPNRGPVQPLDTTARVSASGSHIPQQQQQAPQPLQAQTPPASAAVKSVVWVGRLLVAPQLMPSLKSSVNILLAQCLVESAAGTHIFDAWPRELVISNVVPHRDVQTLLQQQGGEKGVQPIKVQLKVQQPAPPNPALAQAFQVFVDDMTRRQLFGSVSLGRGPHNRDAHILVQIKSQQRDGLQADTLIYCAYLV